MVMSNGKIKKLAPIIMNAISVSKKILLHCHPYPDPDSVGSVLALAKVLKTMGKEVIPIIGDSNYPENLKGLPNSKWIVDKNYSDIDPSKYDLFIILDSASPSQITQLDEIAFSKDMNTIVIDHHVTNPSYGKINL